MTQAMYMLQNLTKKTGMKIPVFLLSLLGLLVTVA